MASIAFHRERGRVCTVTSAESVALDFTDHQDIMAIDSSDDMKELMRRAGMLVGVSGTSPSTSASPGGPASGVQIEWPLHRDLGQQAPAVRTRENYLNLVPRNGLWPTQRTGIEFMRQRERTKSLEFPGGLIADDMGLGKTLQFLTFVLEDSQDLCRRTGKPYGHVTLVVMEKGLVNTWHQQISLHFNSPLFSVAYLCNETPTGMPVDAAILPDAIAARYTLVITTYPVLVAAYSSYLNRSKKVAPFTKALFETTWTRILAEEAHVASNAGSARFKALCALQSFYRWVQTGTPVLNDVSSVCSLLYFIGGPQVVATSALDITARQQRVSGTAAARKSRDQSSDERPLVNWKQLLEVRNLLAEVMLRRRHTLPPLQQRVELIDFETRAERDLYAHYYSIFVEHCRNSIKAAAASSSSSAAHGEVASDDEIEDPDPDADVQAAAPVSMVSVDILRLRQICVAPVVVKNLSLPSHLLLDTGFPEQERAVANTQVRIMRHASVPSLAYLAAASVLLARDPLESANIQPAQAVAPVSEHRGSEFDWVTQRFRSSRLLTNASAARLRSVLDHLRNRIVPSVGTKVRVLARHYCNKIPADDKFIIFSDWVKVLRHYATVFEGVGLATVSITGKQSAAERTNVLAQFARDPSQRGLLGSLQVASNGLNIECANHATLAGPWWNPQTENQSKHRVLRPGQKKQCCSYNVVIRGTVEEDVRRMASEKELIARILLDHDEETRALVASLSENSEAIADVSEQHVIQELMQKALK